MTYSKAFNSKDNKYLYFFRDRKQTAIEDKDWLKHHNGENRVHYDAVFKDKQSEFGTILLESDLELPSLNGL